MSIKQALDRIDVRQRRRRGGDTFTCNAHRLPRVEAARAGRHLSLHGWPRGDLADLLRLDAEEDGELDDPLVEQRSAVDQDQRAARARGDEVRPDHRLADARRTLRLAIPVPEVRGVC